MMHQRLPITTTYNNNNNIHDDNNIHGNKIKKQQQQQRSKSIIHLFLYTCIVIFMTRQYNNYLITSNKNKNANDVHNDNTVRHENPHNNNYKILMNAAKVKALEQELDEMKMKMKLKEDEQEQQQQVYQNNNNNNPNNNLKPENWFQPNVAQEIIFMKMTKTNPMFSMLLFHPKKDFVSNKILNTGFYEMDTTKFIEFALPLNNNVLNNNNSDYKQYVALDLGVNMGFHSLYMAHRGAHVIGFEPSPDTAELARANGRLNNCLLDENYSDESWWNRISSLPNNGSLTIIESAASNVSGKGTLSRVAESTGLTTLGDPSKLPFQLSPLDKKGIRISQSKSLENSEVLIQRADEVLKEFGVPAAANSLQLLKVDVEGFELFALQGIDLNIYPFKYISFEFFPSMIKGCGVNDPVEVLIYVYQRGYRFLELGRDTKGNHIFVKHSRIENNQDSEHDIRAWGEGMVKNAGSARHFNLFAERQ